MALDPEIKTMHALTRRLGALVTEQPAKARKVAGLLLPALNGEYDIEELREVAALLGLINKGGLTDEQGERIDVWLTAKCQELLVPGEGKPAAAAKTA